ncbi:MAG: hypothetical protein AAFX99_30055 [Myxococcota bacterium]
MRQLFIFIPLLLFSSPSWAGPVPSGLYEMYSPATMTPVGRLSPEQTATLPGWLDVTTEGRVVTVVFQPDARVVWRLEYGQHGLAHKAIRVDSELWAASTFSYDAQGLLSEKQVRGKSGETRYTYRHNGSSTIRTTQSSPKRGPQARPQPTETWTRIRHRTGFTTKHQVDGVVVRSDRFDAKGLVLETRFTLNARLVYTRNTGGRLLGVTSHLSGLKPWRFTQRTRREGIVSAHLLPMTRTYLTRTEAHYLLGDPVTARDHGQGAQRAIEDRWSGDSDCWLNDISTFVFDPSGSFIKGDVACICGFCVVETPSSAAEDTVLGTDTHWADGPWVRLDHSLTITAEHRVVTPDGSVAAGELRPGDVVLDADGNPHVLNAVEPLPPGQRRGFNLRTQSGQFTAGGFLLQSEQGRPPRPQAPHCP